MAARRAASPLSPSATCCANCCASRFAPRSLPCVCVSTTVARERLFPCCPCVRHLVRCGSLISNNKRGASPPATSSEQPSSWRRQRGHQARLLGEGPLRRAAGPMLSTAVEGLLICRWRARSHRSMATLGRSPRCCGGAGSAQRLTFSYSINRVPRRPRRPRRTLRLCVQRLARVRALGGCAGARPCRCLRTGCHIASSAPTSSAASALSPLPR